jgi:hypothetical protein
MLLFEPSGLDRGLAGKWPPDSGVDADVDLLEDVDVVDLDVVLVLPQLVLVALAVGLWLAAPLAGHTDERQEGAADGECCWEDMVIVVDALLVGVDALALALQLLSRLLERSTCG